MSGECPARILVNTLAAVVARLASSIATTNVIIERMLRDDTPMVMETLRAHVDAVRHNSKRMWAAERELKIATFEAICQEQVLAHGECYVSVVGRDCDCTSFGYARAVGSYEQAVGVRDNAYDSAEGHVSVTALEKSEYDAFKPFERDLVARAHEDGHPHSVSDADFY